jgi:hypothetical protein
MTSGKQSGVTYITTLLLVAIVAAGLAASAELWSHARQREKEAELIWIGNQFTHAIGLYYQRSPGSIKRYPEKLNDLLEDRRYVSTQRYLRRIYRDPISGRDVWGIVQAPDGGVMGVYSLSDGLAIKTNALHTVSSTPGTQTRYSDWRFIYQPPVTAAK